MTRAMSWPFLGHAYNTQVATDADPRRYWQRYVLVVTMRECAGQGQRPTVIHAQRLFDEEFQPCDPTLR
jgi:hypothetical protein